MTETQQTMTEFTYVTGETSRASSANWSRHGCCCMPKS